MEVEKVARGTTSSVALLLDASARYTLTLTVTDRATGEEAAASREVTLE